MIRLILVWLLLQHKVTMKEMDKRMRMRVGLGTRKMMVMRKQTLITRMTE